jgi:hypothetical protein
VSSNNFLSSIITYTYLLWSHYIIVSRTLWDPDRALTNQHWTVCLNQWVLLQFPVAGGGGGEVQDELTVVTLECAGVLPNGESAAVVRHIELA